MFGDQERPDPGFEPGQRRKVRGIGQFGTAQRQPDPVERDRIARGQLAQHRQARAARDHVVLGMNLEPQPRHRFGSDESHRGSEVLGFETESGGRGGSHRSQALGVSEPTPLGVLIDVQVPLATYFQALPA